MFKTRNFFFIFSSVGWRVKIDVVKVSTFCIVIEREGERKTDNKLHWAQVDGRSMMRGLRASCWSTTMERRKITRAQKTCSYSRLQECQGSLTLWLLLLLLLLLRAALSYCSLENRRRHATIDPVATPRASRTQTDRQTDRHADCSRIRPGEAEYRPPMWPSNATEIPTVWPRWRGDCRNLELSRSRSVCFARWFCNYWTWWDSTYGFVIIVIIELYYARDSEIYSCNKKWFLCKNISNKLFYMFSFRKDRIKKLGNLYFFLC